MSFIHSHMDGHQTAQKAPKTTQEAGFGVNVVLSTDADFDQYISSSSPTFVMFYASCELTFIVYNVSKVVVFE